MGNEAILKIATYLKEIYIYTYIYVYTYTQELIYIYMSI